MFHSHQTAIVVLAVVIFFIWQSKRKAVSVPVWTGRHCILATRQLKIAGLEQSNFSRPWEDDAAFLNTTANKSLKPVAFFFYWDFFIWELISAERDCFFKCKYSKEHFMQLLATFYGSWYPSFLLTHDKMNIYHFISEKLKCQTLSVLLFGGPLILVGYVRSKSLTTNCSLYRFDSLSAYRLFIQGTFILVCQAKCFILSSGKKHPNLLVWTLRIIAK